MLCLPVGCMSTACWRAGLAHCRRAALALAAGTIHRTKGGMAMRSSVGLTVNTLLAVGRASASPVLHMWIVHALWLVANAAGLSFVPHVQVSPTLCQCGCAQLTCLKLCILQVRSAVFA